jgi:hypothetical protein
VHLANAKELVGEFPAAKALYRKVLAADPANLVALNNLAWLLGQDTADAPEALPLISKALQIYGPRAELLDTRASIHLTMGVYSSAVADLTEVVSEAATASRFLHLARARWACGDRDGARKAFWHAKKLGLDVRQLHPLERPVYQKVIVEVSQIKQVVARPRAFIRPPVTLIAREQINDPGCQRRFRI